MTTPPITDFIDRYEFLSNAHWVNVDMDGDTYPSVDHAYQAAKTFDPHRRARIRSASSAHIARLLGRGMKRPEDWEARREGVMRALLANKFAYPDLTEALIATGDAELINGSWDRRDAFWGAGGGGANRLGILLMELRSDLAKGLAEVQEKRATLPEGTDP